MSPRRGRAPRPKPSAAFRELSEPVGGALRVATLLRALASLAGLVPLAAGYLLAKEALDPDGAAPARGTLWTITIVAVVGALVHFALASAAVAISHHADATLQLLLRRRIADHLSRVPLGWFTETNSGTVHRALHDDIDEMHYVVAHARLDLTAALVSPLAALVWLFTVNWALALALITLVPIIGFLVAQRRLIGGARAQMGAVAAAMAAVNAAVVEFVRGAAVLKVFGRGAGAQQRYATAVDEYHRVFTAGNGPILRTVSRSTSLVSPVAMLIVILTGGLLLVEADQDDPAGRPAVRPARPGSGRAGAERGTGHRRPAHRVRRR
ncbi:ABC transporter ATP-binding protein [Candidatus Frankia nodulisporulans]|uniref:ABC transporter ATP-binding protein n=1 Tax=Candidatus Frankia nodulisporulans TaxID=2060052 RepID=UPI0013D5D422|nr:ABC transporter ATP-binding protein [Candidatus Frankia nodulisporulans]